RVTAETHTIDGDAYTVGYTYDSADRVLRVVYPTQSAETVNVAYTAQGLPGRMYSSVDYVRSGNAVYDVAGRLTQLKLGKQSTNNNPVVQMAFTYHPWTASGGLGRLQQVKAGTSANASSLQDLTLWLRYGRQCALDRGCAHQRSTAVLQLRRVGSAAARLHG
ncbi:MAG: hypothetical protein WAV60_08815, partial [Anaerolineae bacterium]